MGFQSQTTDFKPKKGSVNSFSKDFSKRFEEYSKLGWANRKGLKKSTIEGQVPAFAINLFSKKTLASIKKFPELYKRLSSINIAFQYIKYKPKEAIRIYSQRQLFEAKKNTRNINFQRKRKGLKPLKMPTRESLGIKERVENFKRTYPQILKLKRDGEIDTIKSDWTGYLISFIVGEYEDGQILGKDFFFKNPALIHATTKTDIIEKVEKKTKKILEEIDDLLIRIIYGGQSDLKMNERFIIEKSESLTKEGILKRIKEEEEKRNEKELDKFEEKKENKLELDWSEFE